MAWLFTISAAENPNRVNIALNKPAYQSSTHVDYVASRAVDGLDATSMDAASCTHTEPGSSSWWLVSLEDDYVVSTVVLTNRDSNGNPLPHKNFINFQSSKTENKLSYYGPLYIYTLFCLLTQCFS